MLHFLEKVTRNQTAFEAKVKEVSQFLGIDPNWLMAVMYIETAGTFSAAIQNTVHMVQGGFATGLIQFVPNTALMLGTTTAALKQMTEVQQLDYVQKYFAPYRGKIKSFADLYLVTFWPAALGKPDNYVMQTANIKAATVAKSNPGFDLDKNLQITVGEFKKAIVKKLPASVRSYYEKTGIAAFLTGIAAVFFCPSCGLKIERNEGN